MTNCDVAIIGGGPAGAIAGALLSAKNWNVHIYEGQSFPRFSIGESLLPMCVEFLTEANVLDDIAKEEFQFKDGAVFWKSGDLETIDFRKKSTSGPATVWQVQRDRFDDVLLKNAKTAGAQVHFEHRVEGIETSETSAILNVADKSGGRFDVNSRFVLDASGFGRVLPRLLSLDAPSDQYKRRSCFKHVKDFATHPNFDRDKILITVHPNDPKIWLWLIPLSNGMSSIGVVGDDNTIEASGGTPEERLKYWVDSSGFMADILSQSTEARPAAELVGFSRSVKSLSGQNYALLGNAAEFLDPVFSSGVTIAMKSASLATDLVDRQLSGETIDWESQYSDELNIGVEAFRACVNAWYSGLLQKLIFWENRNEDITRHFTSILAGYAWDQNNPIVKDPKRFFKLMDQMTSD